jgi:hypothetical protein
VTTKKLAYHRQQDLRFLRERALPTPLVIGLDEAGRYTVALPESATPLIAARREVVTAFIDGYCTASANLCANPRERTDRSGLISPICDSGPDLLTKS